MMKSSIATEKKMAARNWKKAIKKNGKKKELERNTVNNKKEWRMVEKYMNSEKYKTQQRRGINSEYVKEKKERMNEDINKK